MRIHPSGSAFLGAAIVLAGMAFALGQQEHQGARTIVGGEFLLTGGQVINGDFTAVGAIQVDTLAPSGPLEILVRSVMLALVAALLAALFPIALERVNAVMRIRPGRAAGTGFLVGLAAIMVVVLLALTIFGIPLAIVASMLVVIAVLFGIVALGLHLGNVVQSYFENAWPKMLSASIGTFVLAAMVMTLEQVELIGALVEFALSIVALGAVVLTRFGTRDYRPAGPSIPLVDSSRQHMV